VAIDIICHSILSGELWSEEKKMKANKRCFTVILCIIFLASVILPLYTCYAEDSVITLGTKSAKVKTIKKRLQELRYLEKQKFNNEYNEKTAEAVRVFQRLNGLPETGEVDAETEKVLFSDQAVYAPWPTLEPVATTAPVKEPDWPARDEKGYLDGGGEYFYEDEDEGQWIYLSSNLQIFIRKVCDPSIPLEWFETEILTRNGESMRTVMTDPDRPGTKYRYPYDIAVNHGMVLGFSDDFYADRMTARQTVGIIIREGQIISEKTNRKAGHYLPNLDMLAQYPDGRFEVYQCNELTAGELMDRGAVNVFSFGPVLIRDGEINELLYKYYRSTEPRQALGMIEPNHYYLLSILGRISTSKGTMLQRVAEMMKAKGVKQALNLDGGNTLAIVFRGKILNRKATYKKRTFYRTLTSLIGFGYTESWED